MRTSAGARASPAPTPRRLAAPSPSAPSARHAAAPPPRAYTNPAILREQPKERQEALLARRLQDRVREWEEWERAAELEERELRRAAAERDVRAAPWARANRAPAAPAAARRPRAGRPAPAERAGKSSRFAESAVANQFVEARMRTKASRFTGLAGELGQGRGGGAAELENPGLVQVTRGRDDTAEASGLDDGPAGGPGRARPGAARRRADADDAAANLGARAPPPRAAPDADFIDW
jgi:hypothetical protein